MNLPQMQQLSVQDIYAQNVITSAMDTGSPKRRRRFTAVPRKVTIPVTFTGQQRKEFDVWFRDTIKDGALPFDWEDPVTDELVSYHFFDRPEWGLIRGGHIAGDRIWTSILNLEVAAV